MESFSANSNAWETIYTHSNSKLLLMKISALLKPWLNNTPREM